MAKKTGNVVKQTKMQIRICDAKANNLIDQATFEALMEKHKDSKKVVSIVIQDEPVSP